MTPVRSLLTAIVALVLLIGARPIASIEQYPRGLMSTVTPTAEQSCTISTRSMNFGNYDPLADANVDGTTSIIYTCTKNKDIRIGLTEGSNHSFDPRAMVGPNGVTLEYNLYLDATRRSIWGSGQGYTEAYFDSKPPRDTPVTVVVYGRIFRNQDVPAGEYADMVLASIHF